MPMPPGTRRRLPPLNAVRAFDAAARHASFTRAAEELGVTHGAISRQVALLEEHLGVPLFERRARRVALTPVGRDLLAGIGPALERIAQAAQAAEASAATHRATDAVRVNARPSFALRWLIPHLPRFVLEHPGLEPQVATSTADPAELDEGSFDVVIRRGRRGWPSSLAPRPFLGESAIPVAAPALLAARPVRVPADLAAHTLIHCASRDGDWATWLARAGMPGLRAAAELRFEHLQFSLQAALDGLGVALGPSALVAQDMAAGRLVPVLRSPCLALEDYCLGIAPGAGAGAGAFARWLEREGGSAPSQVDRRNAPFPGPG